MSDSSKNTAFDFHELNGKICEAAFDKGLAEGEKRLLEYRKIECFQRIKELIKRKELKEQKLKELEEDLEKISFEISHQQSLMDQIEEELDENKKKEGNVDNKIGLLQEELDKVCKRIKQVEDSSSHALAKPPRPTTHPARDSPKVAGPKQTLQSPAPKSTGSKPPSPVVSTPKKTPKKAVVSSEISPEDKRSWKEVVSPPNREIFPSPKAASSPPLVAGSPVKTHTASPRMTSEEEIAEEARPPTPSTPAPQTGGARKDSAKKEKRVFPELHRGMSESHFWTVTILKKLESEYFNRQCVVKKDGVMVPKPAPFVETKRVFEDAKHLYFALEDVRKSEEKSKIDGAKKKAANFSMKLGETINTGIASLQDNRGALMEFEEKTKKLFTYMRILMDEVTGITPVVTQVAAAPTGVAHASTGAGAVSETNDKKKSANAAKEKEISDKVKGRKPQLKGDIDNKVAKKAEDEREEYIKGELKQIIERRVQLNTEYKKNVVGNQQNDGYYEEYITLGERKTVFISILNTILGKEVVSAFTAEVKTLFEAKHSKDA